jgi:outer membrane protein
MNRTLKSIITITAFGAAALGLSAQPAPKVLTVDMGKLFQGYYRADEEMAKLKATEQKDEEDVQRMLKEGNQMAEKYKETVEQAKNTMLTPEARSKAEADAGKMMEDLQKRQNEINAARSNAQRVLSQQWNNIRSVLVEEIVKKVNGVAKDKGATLVMDRANLVFADPGYDITDECMVLINKDRPTPAAAATPAPATPASTTTAPDAPRVSVPGLQK